VANQTVVVGTDTLRATLDTRGGDLVKVELVHERASKETKEPVVLLDRSAQRFYVAQSGLVPAGGSTALPNHQTVFTLRPGERTLAAGAKDLPVVFESPEVGGVKLVKTYVFHRGSYAVDVKHEVVNTGSVPANAQLYLRLVRDGTKPPDESSFYSTFTGPAVYTESSKFHKIEFSDVDKGKVDIEKTADNGWVAMVQHYFASSRCRTSAPTRCVPTTTSTPPPWCCRWARSRRAAPRRRTRSCSSARRRKTRWPRWRRAWSW
jgi:YidC/Oxa1 family membrane protein insertase